MARIRTSQDEVGVELSTAERVWALRGDVRVPRTAVTAATVEPDGLAAVQGVRAPGLGLPGLVKVGTWRGRWGKDLVAVRRGEAAVVLDLQGQPWRRLVVGLADVASAREAAEAVLA